MSSSATSDEVEPTRGDPVANQRQYEGFGLHRLSESIAAPDAFAPEPFRKRILADRKNLEGQRKLVTVLFADIVGSTALTAELDSEDAKDRLDPAVWRMIDAVHRHEGTVCRVQGDGIMALFGAPLAREDHALQACKAALAMQAGIEALGDAGIKIRIGLHTGLVVVRAISHDLSMHFDAVGVPVHIAARMEQLAEVGEVRITDHVRRLVEGHIDVASIGPVIAKGIAEPIEVFKLLRRQTSRSRWQVRKARGLTPFAGRAAELRVLYDSFRAACAGDGSVAAICGLPGMGKSRLIDEFVARHAGGQAIVVHASGQPESRTEPYLAIGNALRAWLGIGERDEPSQIGNRLDEWLSRFTAPLQNFRAAFRFLLDLPVTEEAWGHLDPSERKSEMQEALAAVFEETARTRPLILVVEDLHWVDAESRTALDFALPRLVATTALVVLSYRPEHQHDWVAARVRAIDLGPLEIDSARGHIDGLLGGAEQLAELKDAIHERAQGNPLFAEEIVRALAVGGAIRKAGDSYVPVTDAEEIEIPATIQAVIASRIDALAEAPRRVLEIASVIGKTVPAQILAQVAHLERLVAVALLGELQEAGFLDETRIGVDAEYAFCHARVRDVCYESILKAQRRELHGAVLDAFERGYQARIEEFAGRLADHAEKAERWRAAVKYGQLAGTRALERSAYGEAVRLLDRAIDAIGKVGEGEGLRELAVDLRLAQHPALRAVGKIAQVEQRLAEAETICLAIDDRRRLASIKIAQAFAANYLGKLEAAIAAGTEGLGIAKSFQDHVLGIAGAYTLAQAYQWSGQYDRVVGLLAPEAGRIKGPLRDQRIGTAGTTSVLWHGLLGSARAYLGDFESAIGDVDEAAAIAQEIARPYDLVLSKWYQGFVRSHQGRFAEAVPLLEEARRLCVEAKIAFLMPVVGTSLGYAKAVAGRLPEAIEDLERATSQSRRTRLDYAIAWSLCHLGFAYIAARRFGEARAAIEVAFTICQARGFSGVEATARRLLGEVYLSSDDLREASDQAMCAMGLAQSRKMLPEVMHCHALLGRIVGQLGDREHAQQHANTAAELSRTIWFG